MWLTAWRCLAALDARGNTGFSKGTWGPSSPCCVQVSARHSGRRRSADLCADRENEIVRIKIADDYRRFCQVARASRAWNALYTFRGSVERVLGRLNGFRALNYVTLRGMDKVELHCSLSVMVMQAMALGKAKEEAPSAVRNNVRLAARNAEAFGQTYPLYSLLLQIAHGAGGMATRSINV